LNLKLPPKDKRLTPILSKVLSDLSLAEMKPATNHSPSKHLRSTSQVLDQNQNKANSLNL